MRVNFAPEVYRIADKVFNGSGLYSPSEEECEALAQAEQSFLKLQRSSSLGFRCSVKDAIISLPDDAEALEELQIDSRKCPVFFEGVVHELLEVDDKQLPGIWLKTMGIHIANNDNDFSIHAFVPLKPSAQLWLIDYSNVQSQAFAQLLPKL